MAINTFDENMDIISALSDTPNDQYSAADLKAKFDEGGKKIKAYINLQLVPAVNTLLSVISGGYIDPTKIEDGSITTGKIANGAVTGAKIGNGEIVTSKIGDGAVTQDKIGNGEVKTAKLGDGAITNVKIADEAITMAKMGTNSVFYVGTSAPTNTNILWIDTNNGLKYWNGSSWVTVPVGYSS